MHSFQACGNNLSISNGVILPLEENHGITLRRQKMPAQASNWMTLVQCCQHSAILILIHPTIGLQGMVM